MGGRFKEETGSIEGTPPATNVMQIYGSSDRFLPKLLDCLGWSFNESCRHLFTVENLPFPLEVFSIIPLNSQKQEPQIPALEILSNIMTDMGYVPSAERNGEREFPSNGLFLKNPTTTKKVGNNKDFEIIFQKLL